MSSQPPATAPEKDEEPDYRFTLANERTFLAWMRTALATLAAGLVFDQLSDYFGGSKLIEGLSVLMMCMTVSMSFLGYKHWSRVQKAMRRSAPLPRSPMLLPLTSMLIAAAISCILYVVLK
ncbi:YidH family protein [Paracandidimonas soli]|uniref:Putative membrane protein n=1 Tax=Paracandidimonas soli TaxID=1917182 RepID=A0A4R3VF92_9BURK|nr:DUF202 domain-containing protein [Paracandidimonas soli]TCV02653.1 putative membrane protein [Paracandidimonas soli]